MKSMMTRWMIAAAAMTAVAGSAAAQTYKAEIPLSFQVGSKMMRPCASQDARPEPSAIAIEKTPK